MISKFLGFSWVFWLVVAEEDDTTMSRIMRRNEDSDGRPPPEMAAFTVDARAHVTEETKSNADMFRSEPQEMEVKQHEPLLQREREVPSKHEIPQVHSMHGAWHSWTGKVKEQLKMEKPSSPHPAMMTQAGERAKLPGSGNSVAGRKKVALDSTAVVQSKKFAEELILQERETLCPELPSKVNLEILAANTKIAEELIYVFRAKLTTSSHSIPNQAVEILRTGIEVEWMQNPSATTNDEQSAFARAEEELHEKNPQTEPLTRGAKLVLPLSACDLMNVTFTLMCNRSKMIPAPRGASLAQQEDVPDAAIRQMRESYLSLPGGLGVIIDKEKEAYERALKHAKDAGTLLQLEESDSQNFDPDFSWLYERPECLDYVHHQGTCGACYMFAALDSLSDRHCIDTTKASTLGKIDHLSVQMALLCEPEGRQCSGGWAEVGFHYSTYYGLQTASLWPYERSCLSDSQCQFGKQCFSPSSYACPGFFTQEELNEVVTFSDALRVTKRRCDNSNLVDPDNCKVWAEMMFAFSPTMVFMPESCFCDELEEDWAKFAVSESSPKHHGDGSGMTVLLQEQQRGNEEEFNFFTWPYDFITGGHKEKSTEKTEAPANKKEEESWDSDIPGGDWSSEKTITQTPSISLAEQCNRSRCDTEPQIHKSSSHYPVVNHKDDFKRELLKGPFYTSFYVYEDFTWFFAKWPEEAYNYQWGAMQGGHAVVLIGWESKCIYHGDKIQIPGESDPIRQRSSVNGQKNTAECWHLRNTWGDEWGDKGYFRFLDDMLTGPEGYNIHIASAAADGPKSVKE